MGDLEAPANFGNERAVAMLLDELADRKLIANDRSTEELDVQKLSTSPQR